MNSKYLISLLFLGALASNCGDKKSSSQPAPEAPAPDESKGQIDNKPAPTPTPGNVPNTPVVEPKPQVPYDANLGPEIESIDIDLQGFAGAKQLNLGASFQVDDFAPRSSILSHRFHPTITVRCKAEVKDKASSLVLAPLTSIRLAAFADVTGCDAVTIDIPKNPVGYSFDPATMKFAWFVDVKKDDASTLRYSNQTKSGLPVIKDGRGSAKDVITLKAADLRSDGASDKDTYELVAFRQLDKYKTGSLQLAARFWPELVIMCDDKVLDATKALGMSELVFRLTVSADVTNCQTVSIRPSDKTENEGTFEDTSSIFWSVVRTTN